MTNTIDHITFPAIPEAKPVKRSRADLLAEAARRAIALGVRLEDEITEAYTTKGQHTD